MSGLQRPPAQERVVSIEILRFFAAFVVVAFHLAESTHQRWAVTENPFSFGSSGVDVFFVLSGFVIALSAQRTRDAGEFLVRRIARVVPIYWLLTLGVAFIAIATPTLLNSVELSSANLITSLLFIPHARSDGIVNPMLFVGWSLNYEMFFYGVFALTLLWRKWSPLLPCAVIAGLVVAGLIWPSSSAIWTFYTDPMTLDFVFGVLIFMAWQSGKFASIRSNWAAAGLVAASVAWFSIAHAAGLPRALGPGLAAALLLVAALSWQLTPVRPVTRLFVALGGASYALYLCHPFIISAFRAAVFDHAQSGTVLAAASVLVVITCLVASVVLHRLIELPAQNELLRLWRLRQGEAGGSALPHRTVVAKRLLSHPPLALRGSSER